VLASVFSATTTRLLGRIPVGNRRLVVDLGCGPGYTTRLLREVLSPERLMAVDASASFAAQAMDRLGGDAEVLVADVSALPNAISGVDFMFARFLLTHLAEPVAAVQHWLSRLAPSGLIAVEEVESITTAEPVLSEYLALQRHMLEVNANRLEIGPFIAEAARRCGARCSTEVVTLTPSPSIAARMFAMNFTSWRTHPTVSGNVSQRELDLTQAGLLDIATGRRQSAPITWELRHARITPTMGD
jgi:trans-aconitate 2-methyltransferase